MTASTGHQDPRDKPTTMEFSDVRYILYVQHSDPASIPKTIMPVLSASITNWEEVSTDITSYTGATDDGDDETDPDDDIDTEDTDTSALPVPDDADDEGGGDDEDDPDEEEEDEDDAEEDDDVQRTLVLSVAISPELIREYRAYQGMRIADNGALKLRIGYLAPSSKPDGPKEAVFWHVYTLDADDLQLVQESHGSGMLELQMHLEILDSDKFCIPSVVAGS